MPNTVIETNFYRLYSRGVTFKARLDGTSVPIPITPAYLNAMNFIAGVKSIKGPKMGRAAPVDMEELNAGTLSSLTSPGLNDTLGTAVTQEMFWYKVKAPNTKDYGPVELTLNMTSIDFGALTKWYERDRVFPWAILIPMKASTDEPPNTVCMFFGFGFVKSLKPTIKKSELVTVDASIQPSNGVGFISTCLPLSALSRVWQNFISGGVC